MLSRLLLILVLALQPLSMQGVGALADLAHTGLTSRVTDAPVMARSCCASMPAGMECPMRAGNCGCAAAPTDPPPPAPAPTPARAHDATAQALLASVQAACPDEALPARTLILPAGQPVPPAAHNIVQARLGVWRT